MVEKDFDPHLSTHPKTQGLLAKRADSHPSAALELSSKLPNAAAQQRLPLHSPSEGSHARARWGRREWQYPASWGIEVYAEDALSTGEDSQTAVEQASGRSWPLESAMSQEPCSIVKDHTGIYAERF